MKIFLSIYLSVFILGLAFPFYENPPSPGLASILLGFLATAITLLPPKYIKPQFRLILISIFIALMCIEIKAIQVDRIQSQEQFSKIAGLAQESLMNIVGGDSVPYIVPQTHAQTKQIPLEIWNRGKYILSGVTVVIRNGRDYTNPASFFSRQQLEVGIVHPGFGRLLTAGIFPNPDSTGVDDYIIEISTQSDLFVETLNFRKSKYSLPWAYQYWVTKEIIEKPGVTRGVIVVDQSAWSDDLGEGKPVINQ